MDAAIRSLQHALAEDRELLDAAHMLPDPAGGDPVVAIGLSLCWLRERFQDAG